MNSGKITKNAIRAIRYIVLNVSALILRRTVLCIGSPVVDSRLRRDYTHLMVLRTPFSSALRLIWRK